MKVYVSELPKGKDIRFEIDGMVLAIDMSDKDKSYLMIGDKEQDNNFRVEFCSDNEVLVNCVAKILEHFADYTKQARKEVCNEVRQAINESDFVLKDGFYYIKQVELNDKIDQIQGD